MVVLYETHANGKDDLLIFQIVLDDGKCKLLQKRLWDSNFIHMPMVLDYGIQSMLHTLKAICHKKSLEPQTKMVFSELIEFLAEYVEKQSSTIRKSMAKTNCYIPDLVNIIIAYL